MMKLKVDDLKPTNHSNQPSLVRNIIIFFVVLRKAIISVNHTRISSSTFLFFFFFRFFRQPAGVSTSCHVDRDRAYDGRFLAKNNEQPRRLRPGIEPRLFRPECEERI